MGNAAPRAQLSRRRLAQASPSDVIAAPLIRINNSPYSPAPWQGAPVACLTLILLPITHTTMEPSALEHDEIEAIVLSLDPTLRDCRLRIADVRKQMDASCDKGLMTISQWRRLLDAVAALQSRCVDSQPRPAPY